MKSRLYHKLLIEQIKQSLVHEEQIDDTIDENVSLLYYLLINEIYSGKIKERLKGYENMFENLTIELLKHKYVYYVQNTNLISDQEYDFLERDWYKLGVLLEQVDVETTSPCVGFDETHILANKAIERYKNG